MGYERYPRGTNSGDSYNSRSSRDDDWGRDGASSGARDYRTTGQSGGDREYGQRDYGQRDYSERNYGQYGGQRERQGGWGDQNRTYAGGDRDEWRGQDFGGGRDYYQGDDRGYGRQGSETYRQQRGAYGRQPQGYAGDRGFMARAADEVRSWIGDEDAERRREADARRDEQQSGGRDEHYHNWRNQQVAAFDRDYHEYRQENQSKFHNEFASFRTERQGQRDLLSSVMEHAEVVGSDGEHVGTVDKVRGDRIILTKNDADAGGRHHSIPSRWLQSADGGKVTLRKTASEAKDHWRDEERQQEGQGGSRGAMFGDRDGRQSGEGDYGANLNRSFSGTY